MPYRVTESAPDALDERERFDDPASAAAVRAGRLAVVIGSAAAWAGLMSVPLFLPESWVLYAVLGIAPLALFVRTLDQWESLSPMERIGSLVRFGPLEADETDLRWAELTGKGRGARLRLRVEAPGQQPRDINVVVRPNQSARVSAFVEAIRERTLTELDEQPIASATPTAVRRFRRRRWTLVALELLAAIGLSLVTYVLVWRGHLGHAFFTAVLTLFVATFARSAYLAASRGMPVQLSAKGVVMPNGATCPWTRCEIVHEVSASFLVETVPGSRRPLIRRVIAEPPVLLDRTRARALGLPPV